LNLGADSLKRQKNDRTRRQFLTFTALSSISLLHPLTGYGQTNSRAWCFSACNDSSGQHFVAGWPILEPNKGFKVAVPLRAHDSVVHPTRSQVLFFSRRPGKDIYCIDYQSHRLVRTLHAKTGHHFYGHGCFSADGNYLFTSENPFHRSRIKGSEGVIGIYDSTDYQRIGEIPSGGIGPHQLKMMPDQGTLVVANGGIFTHPALPREKLNLDSMQSSLVYIDTKNQKTIDHYYPQDPQMSIRHLDCSSQNQVIMGVQYQGPAFESRPLVLSHKGEDQLQAMLADESIWRSQEQYIASVAIDPQGGMALTSAPRGGVVDCWDLSQGEHKQQFKIRDAAGLSFNPKQQKFVISNGRGQILQLSSDNSLQVLQQDALQWDNHLSSALI